MKNLQEVFLNTLRKEKIPCTIIITNGYQMKNTMILSFDSFAILAEYEGKQSLLFKHAISSISPSKNINLAIDECK